MCINSYTASIQQVDETEDPPFIFSESIEELKEDAGRDACCVKFGELVELGPIAIEGQEHLLGACRLEVDSTEADFFVNDALMCEGMGSQVRSFFSMDDTMVWTETKNVDGPASNSDCCMASTGADDPRQELCSFATTILESLTVYDETTMTCQVVELVRSAMVTEDGTQIGGPSFSSETEIVDMSACCLASTDYRQNEAACMTRVESRLAYAYEAETDTCFEELFETTILVASVDEITTVEMP